MADYKLRLYNISIVTFPVTIYHIRYNNNIILLHSCSVRTDRLENRTLLSTIIVFIELSAQSLYT